MFGEKDLDTTPNPELVYFKTDFGVTFGTFIGYDILFKQPSESLMEHGVTDIVYPTLWHSELPFLTGKLSC